MPLFGRRRKQPPTPVAQPDPDLTPLDVERAAYLRRLVHDDLAGRGIESEILLGRLRTADRTSGLENLARTVVVPDRSRVLFRVVEGAEALPAVAAFDAFDLHERG